MALSKEAQGVLDNIHQYLNDKNSYIFRGESKQFPEISSTLYRQHKSEFENHNKLDLLAKHLTKIEENIINKAKRLFPTNTSNFEILTELQHFGGKTTLLDFSTNVYIALFFACHGNSDQDGHLIFVNRENIKEAIDTDIYEPNFLRSYENGRDGTSIKDKEEILLLKPFTKNNRVIFQSSVFLHLPHGTMPLTAKVKKVIIPSQTKKELLSYLNNGMSININSIYNDLTGFIENEENFKSPILHLTLGVGHYHNKEFESSECEFLRALEIDSNSSNTYYGLAESQLSLYHQNKSTDKLKAALNSINASIKIDSSNVNFYSCRSRVYFSFYEYNTNTNKSYLKRAVNDIKKAIDIDPNDAISHTLLGNILGRMGKHLEAINSLTKAIAIDPQTQLGSYLRGLNYHILGKYEKAINDYQNVPTTDDQYHRSRTLLEEAKRQEPPSHHHLNE